MSKTETTEIKPEYRSNSYEQCMAHIAEECGEFIAAYGKGQRFGWQSVNPELPPDQQETNQEWALRELNDLFRSIKAYHAFCQTRSDEELANDKF